MSNKYLYVIIRTKTGKPIIEDARLPVYWNKKAANYRAKDFIGVTVIPIIATEFESILNKAINGRK